MIVTVMVGVACLCVGWAFGAVMVGAVAAKRIKAARLAGVIAGARWGRMARPATYRERIDNAPPLDTFDA